MDGILSTSEHKLYNGRQEKFLSRRDSFVPKDFLLLALGKHAIIMQHPISSSATLDARGILFSAFASFVVLASALTLMYPAQAQGKEMLYTFDQSGTLDEAGSMSESSSPYFWINSGGSLAIRNGVGETIQGALSGDSIWHTLYAAANALDTENGAYPQSLFRLVTKSTWGDLEESISFRITNQHMTDSPNRDGHNGVLLFGRYQNGDNLYYAGVRDDGQATIKKKINGTYHTLASAQIFGTSGKYDRHNTPTLLPINKWTGLKMTIENAWDGSVLVRLLLDRENDGSFVSILSARDSGTGGAPLRTTAHAGIRTDFKDVQFENYRLRSI